MSIESVAAFSTASGTIIAVLALVATEMRARRERADDSRERAADRAQTEALAKRQEAATRLAVDQTAKIVEALTRIAERPSNPTAAVADPRPRWRITWDNGDEYRLTNIGSARAYGVRIDSHPSLDIIPVTDQNDIGPDESIVFIAAMSLATSDLTITVTWQEGESDRQEWRYPLPPKGM